MAALQDTLDHTPVELNFGTSGLRGLVEEMTALECYINTRGFIAFLKTQEALDTQTPIYIGGDLRSSTPGIMVSVHQAIQDEGCTSVNLGTLPAPALAYYALSKQSPGIMVTGSHIPADRNGIKFNKAGGEVLKADEPGIKAAVAEIRHQVYTSDHESSIFNASGQLKQSPALPPVESAGVDLFLQRYTDVFSPSLLEGRHIVVYQHSSVGRDLLVELLERLGANVSPVGRSETFIPIDTENVTQSDRQYFKKLASDHQDAFAIISADGDADRPFVIDETGSFHRGDTLGVVVAQWLKADFAAVPISASDAVEKYAAKHSLELAYTKIGSPYVIAAMDAALEQGKKRVMGWEVNGGFLLGVAIDVANGRLEALPTRDAFLPILCALAAAIEVNAPLSALFHRLPARFTASGLVDNFPMAASRRIVDYFADDNDTMLEELVEFFSAVDGFGDIIDVNTMDGIRVFFSNGDIAHLRPSGNAPQLRLYSVSDTQARADEMVQIAISEPDGIIRRLERQFS